MHSILTAFLTTQLGHQTESCPAWKKGEKKAKGFSFVCLQTQSSTWKIKQGENKLWQFNRCNFQARKLLNWQMKPTSINLCSRTALALCVSHSHRMALTFMAQKSSRKSSSHSTPFLLWQRYICSICNKFSVKWCRCWHHKVTADF